MCTYNNYYLFRLNSFFFLYINKERFSSRIQFELITYHMLIHTALCQYTYSETHERSFWIVKNDSMNVCEWSTQNFTEDSTRRQTYRDPRRFQELSRTQFDYFFILSIVTLIIPLNNIRDFKNRLN